VGYLPELHRWNKVINEEDFSPVHVLRLVLQIGKLLRRRGGAFHATPRGRDMLGEGGSGALAATLFRVLYRDFNLGYLGGWEEFEERQPMVPLFLLRLKVLAREWRAAREIVPLVDPAADLDVEIASAMARWPDAYPRDDAEAVRQLESFAFSSFVHRILDPIEWFGLLEGREVPGLYPTLHDREMRTTPLLHAFLTFPAAFTNAAAAWSR